MKKLVMSLVTAFAAFCSLADTEKVGGVKWSYYPTWDDSEGGYVAVVTGASPASGALNIPSVLGGYPVRVIGEGSFEDCNSLTSVDIPASVKVIGKEAFCDCDNLASINLAEGLETIGYDAFCDCINLGDVYIPSTVREGIGFAFAYKMIGCDPSSLGNKNGLAYLYLMNRGLNSFDEDTFHDEFKLIIS